MITYPTGLPEGDAKRRLAAKRKMGRPAAEPKGVGGGEKGYQNGGEVVPCQASQSVWAFPSSQECCPERPGVKGAAVVSPGKANP